MLLSNKAMITTSFISNLQVILQPRPGLPRVPLSYSIGLISVKQTRTRVTQGNPFSVGNTIVG